MLGTIDLKLLRELTILGAGPKFLSSASGLVGVGGKFFVVADDELSLGVFSAKDNEPGDLLRLFPGELSDRPKDRKAQKPDIESIVFLSAKHFPPYGALLALPSGSSARRCLGALIALDEFKNPIPNAQMINLIPLYQKISDRLVDLNIEGACIYDGKLKLLQRGHAGGASNAVIEIELAGILHDLRAGRDPAASHELEIATIELGQLRGTPLTFTDAAVNSEGFLWFLAAAEKTNSSYDDGVYLGAAIGVLKSDNSLAEIYELNCPFKPEGLWFGDRGEFYVVTDADDRLKPSRLYSGSL